MQAFQSTYHHIQAHTLTQGQQGAFAGLPDDRIAFPVTQPLFLIDDSRALVNALAVTYTAPAIVASISFAIGLAHDPQVRVKIPAVCLISQYHLVDRLVVEAHPVLVRSEERRGG